MIDESSQYLGMSAYGIVNWYVTNYARTYAQTGTPFKPSAIIPLHKTNGSCMQVSLNESGTFANQALIGCTYGGRGYVMFLMDGQIAFPGDLKTFFDPILNTLVLY